MTFSSKRRQRFFPFLFVIIIVLTSFKGFYLQKRNNCFNGVHKNDFHLKQKQLLSRSIGSAVLEKLKGWIYKSIAGFWLNLINCWQEISPPKKLAGRENWSMPEGNCFSRKSRNKRGANLLWKIETTIAKNFLGRVMFKCVATQTARWPHEHARRCSLMWLTRPKTGPTVVIGCCWLTWRLEWWVLQLTHEPWFLVLVPRICDGAAEMIKEMEVNMNSTQQSSNNGKN